MKAPIVSKKHIVQFTEFNVLTATVTGHEFVKGAAVSGVDTPSEVVEGQIVKAIYLEYWFTGQGSNTASFVAILEKVASNPSVPSLSEMTTLDSYNNKKNILYTTQGLVASSNDNPTPIFRGWFKIPRGKQRFGLSDVLRVNIAAIGAEGISGCGFGTYKAYS